jgi:hypothetical protein
MKPFRLARWPPVKIAAAVQVGTPLHPVPGFGVGVGAGVGFGAGVGVGVGAGVGVGVGPPEHVPPVRHNDGVEAGFQPEPTNAVWV